MSLIHPDCSVWDAPPQFPLPPSRRASRQRAVVGPPTAGDAGSAVATCSAFPALLRLACHGNASAAASSGAASSSDALCLQTARDLANIRPWGANDASASAAAAAAATSTADPPPTSCLDALASPGSVCLVLALAACVGAARSRVCARRRRHQSTRHHHHHRGDVSPRSLREGDGEGGGGRGGEGEDGDGIEDPEGSAPPSAQEVRLEDVVTVLWAFVELAGVVSTLLCRAVYGRASGGRERVVFSYRVHYSSPSGGGGGDDGGDDDSGALLEELFINDLGTEVGGLVWGDRTALFESAREEHRRRQTLCAQYASYLESLAAPPPLAPCSLLPKSAALDNAEPPGEEAEEAAAVVAALERGPHEGDELCCICLDVLGSAQTLTLTSCVHSHHLGCLTDYAVHQVKRGVGRPCCPTCRTAIKLPWSCDDGGGGSGGGGGSAEEDAYLNDVSMRADLDELDTHADLAAQLDNEWSYNMFVGGGSQLFC